MVLRKTQYAGSWYPSTKEELNSLLKKCFSSSEFGPRELPTCLNQDKRTIIGGVSPHAGMQISGPCAAFTFLNLFKEKIPDLVIVIGFYHRETGPDALLEEGEWETPLGNLKIDEQSSQKLLSISNIITSEKSVFIRTSENSLELLMPFIKYCAGEKDVKILPIKIISHNFKQLDQIAADVADLIKSSPKDMVVVVSSDMSHYNVYDNEQLQTLKKIDQIEIDQFLKLDPEKFLNPETYIDSNLYNKFHLGENRPSVCGRHTMATLISIGNKLNVKKGLFLKNYNSKDIYPNGNPWTVGYFSGILIK